MAFARRGRGPIPDPSRPGSWDDGYSGRASSSPASALRPSTPLDSPTVLSSVAIGPGRLRSLRSARSGVEPGPTAEATRRATNRRGPTLFPIVHLPISPCDIRSVIYILAHRSGLGPLRWRRRRLFLRNERHYRLGGPSRSVRRSLVVRPRVWLTPKYSRQDNPPIRTTGPARNHDAREE